MANDLQCTEDKLENRRASLGFLEGIITDQALKKECHKTRQSSVSLHLGSHYYILEAMTEAVMRTPSIFFSSGR